MIQIKIARKGYHSIKVPRIDITNYLNRTGNWQKDCKDVAQIFRTYGLAIIKDPRVSQQQNDQFLNLMENYFTKRSQQFREGNKTIDFSPENNYTVGIMHEFQ
jgi:isopenicillin N synthase-like dioxygenase